MLLKENQFAMQVPDKWSEFDRNRENYEEDLSWKFDKATTKQILKVIENNWSRFAGNQAVVIKVEGYDCLTWVTKYEPRVECSDTVYPFDGTRIYPSQRIEERVCFKRY